MAESEGMNWGIIGCVVAMVACVIAIWAIWLSYSTKEELCIEKDDDKYCFKATKDGLELDGGDLVIGKLRVGDSDDASR